MYHPRGEPVVFSRDCDAVVIPAGDSGTIPQGAEGTLTQALGGSYTVYIQGSLFRIAGVDGDAIGKDAATPPELPDNATDTDVEKLIWDQLHTCFDPEIPIDIVELGLVYGCDVKRLDSGEREVDIEMTLTAPGCGMGEILAGDIKSKLEMIPTIRRARVDLVFDPPWSADMMSEAARLQTGMI
ncbi:MAG: putative Fe-S cluster assembly protein SufT [Aquisalimonadaceae bacterium]